MKIFIETKQIIEVFEEQLLGQKSSDWKPLAWLQRRFLYPFKFLKLGIEQRLAGAFFWSVSAFIFMAISTFVLNAVEIENAQIRTFVILFAEVIPLFLVLFALPSTYGAGGVTKADVKVVTLHLANRDFKRLVELETLTASINRFEKSVRSRIVLFKSLLALLWAYAVYMFNFGINQNFAVSEIAVSFYIQIIILILITAGIYLLAWGYESSIDRLFRGLYFGIDEYRTSITKQDNF